MNSSTQFKDNARDGSGDGPGAEPGTKRAKGGSTGWGVGGRSGRGNNRVAVGIALSIAAHLALLFAFRYHAPLPRDDSPAAPERLVVYLKAAPPPVPRPEPPPTQAAAAQPKPAARRAPAARPQRKTAPATDVIALPDTETPAEAPARDSQFTVAPPGAEKTFDPEAARKFARAIATKPDPARAGMAVAQIPEKPMATETRTARLIGAAKRPDCKDVPANLLTPLLMLLDKKDSGCKW